MHSQFFDTRISNRSLGLPVYIKERCKDGSRHLYMICINLCKEKHISKTGSCTGIKMYSTCTIVLRLWELKTKRSVMLTMC